MSLDNTRLSSRRLQIDRANSTVVVTLAISAFLVTFLLVGCRALLSKQGYQSRLVSKKTKTLRQIKENKAAIKGLTASYQTFANSPQNIIGGNPKGNGDRDGDNAKIVLDALPSKYDFPAVTSSLEKLLSDKNFRINSLEGVDDEIAQNKPGTVTPQPIEIPFKFDVSGTYQSIQNLTGLLDRSIRPFKIETMSFFGNDNDLTIDVSAKTYYQPEKVLNITTEVVQ